MEKPLCPASPHRHYYFHIRNSAFELSFSVFLSILAKICIRNLAWIANIGAEKATRKLSEACIWYTLRAPSGKAQLSLCPRVICYEVASTYGKSSFRLA